LEEILTCQVLEAFFSHLADIKSLCVFALVKHHGEVLGVGALGERLLDNVADVALLKLELFHGQDVSDDALHHKPLLVPVHTGEEELCCI
jgi:hypothetical protein